MASGQKHFSKGTDFVEYIENLISKGDRNAILSEVKNCQRRNHLVALGTRLKQLLVHQKCPLIFIQITAVECQNEFVKILHQVFGKFCSKQFCPLALAVIFHRVHQPRPVVNQ